LHPICLKQAHFLRELGPICIKEFASPFLPRGNWGNLVKSYSLHKRKKFISFQETCFQKKLSRDLFFKSFVCGKKWEFEK
jgi:hypothetical protein